MTKEEIKQTVSVIISSEASGNSKRDSILLLIENLKAEEYQRGFMDCYEQSNTVGLEVQKRAFEAGRNITINSGVSSSSGDPFYEEFNTYETFEDYLKHLEDGNN